MTNRKALVLLLLLACVAVREPSYKGRPLSEWLDFTHWEIDDTQRLYAVRQIGTNALPIMLEWLRYQPSPLRIKIQDWFGKHQVILPNRKARLPQEALIGFQALGEWAKPAIPALVPLLDGTNRITQAFAAKALGAIGKNALPTLLDALTNSPAHKNFYRPIFAMALANLRTNAFLAKPILLAHVRDPDTQVADGALFGLGALARIQDRLGLPPDTTADILPVLCANLDSTNTHLVLYTISALGTFHSNALPVVPVLLQNLSSTNKTLRDTSALALKQLDPKALEHAQNQ